MDADLIKIFTVTTAVLIGLIAGLVALHLARVSKKDWVVSFTRGASVFAATVVFVLVIADHL